MGVWEHRGKVAAVDIGHSPTNRRWDGKPETSVGAWAILALRKAIEDAGVSPDQVDGLVMDSGTTTGAYWGNRQVPQDFRDAFQQTDNPLDGIAQLSADWILKNMPELTNVKFIMYGPGCMSNAIVVAAQAVGDGLTNTCIVLKGWHNFEQGLFIIPVRTLARSWCGARTTSGRVLRPAQDERNPRGPWDNYGVGHYCVNIMATGRRLWS